MEEDSRTTILLNLDSKVDFLGEHNKNLKFLEKLLQIKIFFRDDKLHIKGRPKNIPKAEKAINYLLEKTKQGNVIEQNEIQSVIDNLDSKITDYQLPREFNYFYNYKKQVFPKSENQMDYLDSIVNYDIVFGIGPAGTGKTFLAVAAAVAYLQANQVNKIVITRPVLEAGENLGFLPGDFRDKINPYLQPIYDSLNNIIPRDKVSRLLKENIIEIAPLAYMRGRTLSNAFVILDEAQNTTITQMKMFLTRLGMGSKMLITGDITQVDLGAESGLAIAERILSPVEDFSFIYFTHKDVIRHRLVKSILSAFDNYEDKT